MAMENSEVGGSSIAHPYGSAVKGFHIGRDRVATVSVVGDVIVGGHLYGVATDAWDVDYMKRLRLQGLP